MYRRAIAPTPRLAWGKSAAPSALRGFGDNPDEVYGYLPTRSVYRRPMLVGLGQDMPVLGTRADVVPWDASLAVSSGRVPPQNNGCPADYFAQFVGRGEPGGVAVAGTGYALRCRLMATSTPQTIVDESGVTIGEALDVYQQAVKDTARQVGAAAAQAFSWTPYLLWGAAALVGGVVLLRVTKVLA